MNYTIIGNDGKSYGPIGAEQLRQWIRQSRIESRTPVFVQGTADWTFVGLLPEFTAEFPGTPPVITPSAPGAPAAATRTSQLAIWGFICGVVSWTMCGCCVPLAIVGLTFSIIALVQVNARTEPLTGRGFAIAGIVLSGTNLAWSLGLTVMGMLDDPAKFQTHFGNLVN